MKNSRAFTLIELLVVVLIIGILAAVALPQYKKAVYKSRAGQMISLVRSLAVAQEAYYLAHGKYAQTFAQLDVDLPGDKTAGCNNIYMNYDECYTLGNEWLIGLAPDGNGEIAAIDSYYPKGNFKIGSYLLHPSDAVDRVGLFGTLSCIAQNDDAKKICASLGTPTENVRYFKL